MYLFFKGFAIFCWWTLLLPLAIIVAIVRKARR